MAFLLYLFLVHESASLYSVGQAVLYPEVPQSHRLMTMYRFGDSEHHGLEMFGGSCKAVFLSLAQGLNMRPGGI